METMLRELKTEAKGIVTYWSLSGVFCRETVAKSLNDLQVGRKVSERSPMVRLPFALRELFPDAMIRSLKTNGCAVVFEEKGEDANEYHQPYAIRLTDGKLECVPEINETLRNTITEKIEWTKTIIPANNLGNILSDICKDLNGVNLRPGGAVYWIPEASVDVWKKVEQAVQGACVEATASASVYVLKPPMDENAMKAIQDALINDVTVEANDIKRHVLSGELGVKAIDGKRAQAEHLRSKIRSYEEILGQGLEKLLKQVEEVETAAASAALLASAKAAAEARN